MHLRSITLSTSFPNATSFRNPFSTHSKHSIGKVGVVISPPSSTHPFELYCNVGDSVRLVEVLGNNTAIVLMLSGSQEQGLMDLRRIDFDPDKAYSSHPNFINADLATKFWDDVDVEDDDWFHGDSEGSFISETSTLRNSESENCQKSIKKDDYILSIKSTHSVDSFISPLNITDSSYPEKKMSPTPPLTLSLSEFKLISGIPFFLVKVIREQCVHYVVRSHEELLELHKCLDDDFFTYRRLVPCLPRIVKSWDSCNVKLFEDFLNILPTLPSIMLHSPWMCHFFLPKTDIEWEQVVPANYSKNSLQQEFPVIEMKSKLQKSFSGKLKDQMNFFKRGIFKLFSGKFGKCHQHQL